MDEAQGVLQTCMFSAESVSKWGDWLSA